MSLENLMELLESRLDEVKLWKNIIEKPIIKKKSKSANSVNEKIKEFAKVQVKILEKLTNSNQTQINATAFLEKIAENQLERERASIPQIPTEAEVIRDDKMIANLLKTSTHRERKKLGDNQKDNYPFKTGQEALLLTTENLTAVNAQQRNQFVSNEKVKVARVYTNQYDEDVAEILKETRSGMIKGVVNVDDLQI